MCARGERERVNLGSVLGCKAVIGRFKENHSRVSVWQSWLAHTQTTAQGRYNMLGEGVCNRVERTVEPGLGFELLGMVPSHVLHGTFFRVSVG